MPSAATTRQCHLDHGRRSRRAGISVLIRVLYTDAATLRVTDFEFIKGTQPSQSQMWIVNASARDLNRRRFATRHIHSRIWTAGQLHSLSRKALWVPHLKVLEQLLAHLASQIPGAARIVGGHQDTQLNRIVVHVGDLKVPESSIPQLRTLENVPQLVAYRLNRDREVDLHKNRDQQVCRVARPVLEGPFDELHDRKNQPALVPKTDRNVDQGDVLNLSPLPVNHDHVVDPDGLGEEDL